MKRSPFVILIIIAIVLVLMPVVLVVNFLRMPASPTVISMVSKMIFDQKEMRGAYLKLQEKSIEHIQPEDGKKLEAFGYSLILIGYESVKFMSKEDDFAKRYQLGEKKLLCMFDDMEKDFS